MSKATEIVVNLLLATLVGLITAAFAAIAAGICCAYLALGELSILVVYLVAICAMLFTSYKAFQKLQNP